MLHLFIVILHPLGSNCVMPLDKDHEVAVQAMKLLMLMSQ